MNCAADKDLQFDVEGLDDGAEAPVEGVSRAALLAILRNLLENAFHYTPAGGSVTLRVSRTPERLVMSVADTGPGIAPEERSRVFDPFYRITGSGLPGTASACDREDLRRHDGAEVTLADTVAGRHASRPDGRRSAVLCRPSVDLAPQTGGRADRVDREDDDGRPDQHEARHHLDRKRLPERKAPE